MNDGTGGANGTGTTPAPAGQKDPSIRAAYVTGWFSLAAAAIGTVVGFLGLPTVVTSPTADVPTQTATATVTRPGPTVTVAGPAAGSSPDAATSGPPRTVPSSPEWINTFQGPVTLVSTWTDLDVVPPAEGSASDVQVVGYVNGVYLKAWKLQAMAKVPADDPDPTPVACGALVDASSPTANRVTVAPGDRVCLRTPRDRMALIYITETDVRAPDNSSVTTDVIVWAGPDTPS